MNEEFAVNAKKERIMHDVDPILEPGVYAPVEDFRHRTLKRAGYELRREGDSTSNIWWRHDERIGRTTLAMQHCDTLFDQIERAKNLLAEEGYRVTAVNRWRDPRWPFRLYMAILALLSMLACISIFTGSH